jgi:hypothetical protein
MTVEKNMRFSLDTRSPNLLERRHHSRRYPHPDNQQLTCDMNRAKVIIKDNCQLLDLLEEVKAIPSVKDVIWSLCSKDLDKICLNIEAGNHIYFRIKY